MGFESRLLAARRVDQSRHTLLGFALGNRFLHAVIALTAVLSETNDLSPQTLGGGRCTQTVDRDQDSGAITSVRLCNYLAGSVVLPYRGSCVPYVRCINRGPCVGHNLITTNLSGGCSSKSL